MSFSRKRAMTWTLVVLGILIVGLGAALIATFPWSQSAAQGVAPGVEPAPGTWQGYAPWYGSMHGWRFFHGPRFFGGGLLIAVILVVVISLAAGRWRSWRHEERLDAEEILRRTFAEGRITEEEYQSRLRALRK
ncbi:MAG TPA: hypothetical protein VL354_18535 [Spirochaetia bacterium]|nr:hypothetical protein [Spirochaetia bacterium]